MIYLGKIKNSKPMHFLTYIANIFQGISKNKEKYQLIYSGIFLLPAE